MKLPFLTFLLLLSFAGSVAVTGHTLGAPQGVASNDAAVAKGTLSLTLYLTDALHLSYTQALAVRECTRTELLQLAHNPTQEANQLVRADYDKVMARTLTPEQYRVFQHLETRNPVVSTFASVM